MEFGGAMSQLAHMSNCETVIPLKYLEVYSNNRQHNHLNLV